MTKRIAAFRTLPGSQVEEDVTQSALTLPERDPAESDATITPIIIKTRKPIIMADSTRIRRPIKLPVLFRSTNRDSTVD